MKYRVVRLGSTVYYVQVWLRVTRIVHERSIRI